MDARALTSRLSMGVLATLAACSAVGPDYERPELPTPERFADRASESVQAEQLADWWSVFDDAALSELVDAVLVGNLDLATAVESVAVARARYGVTAAARVPQVDADAQVARVEPRFGTMILPTQDQWSAGLGLSWELDLFGRVRRSVEAARADVEARIEDARGAQVLLAAETAANFLALVSLQERLDIAAANVESQQRSLEIAEARHEVGMAAGLDPAQARVNLHTTEARVPVLQRELGRTRHRLAVLTGREPRALVDAFADQRALPVLPDALQVGVPADLLLNRPDIRALERDLAAQTARIGVAEAARYPRLQLVGSWDWLDDAPGGLFRSETAAGAIAVPATLPLFTGGRLEAAVDAEEAVTRQLALSLRQALLVAQEEVENALIALVRDRERAERLDAAVAAARSSVALSRELYTSGQSDFQNVLDAQRSLFALEDERAVARLDTLLDVVDLYRALGGGWGAEAIPDGAPATADDPLESSEP